MRILFVLLFLCLQIICTGQQNKKSNLNLSQYARNTSYTLAIKNIGIGMPPNFVNGRFHLGLAIGLEHQLKIKNSISKFYYALQFGYFYIQSLQTAYYTKPGIAYTFAPMSWLKIRPSLSNAFMLVRQINDEFTYTGNGNYERVNRSRFQINPSFGVDAVLKIGDLKKYRYGLMLGYEFGVQLPFSELSSVLPLNQLKIGMRLENIDHTSN